MTRTEENDMGAPTHDTATRLADLGNLVATVGIDSATDAVAEVLELAASVGIRSVAIAVLADASQSPIARERALAHLSGSIVRHQPANAAFSLVS